jgi:hypothetical protein
MSPDHYFNATLFAYDNNCDRRYSASVQLNIREGIGMTEEMKERAVLVTTVHKGVFFGYVEGDTSGSTIKLKRARNCLYWTTENKGFLGLASKGPLQGSRVGPAVDIELRDITCVAEVSDEAVERWERSPWK